MHDQSCGTPWQPLKLLLRSNGTALCLSRSGRPFSAFTCQGDDVTLSPSYVVSGISAGHSQERRLRNSPRQGRELRDAALHTCSNQVIKAKLINTRQNTGKWNEENNAVMEI
ncbi:hypothetical protein E2C01_027636 [Portunus trituberculatus]|uniref:Uncharacterized protein n=1 Tax=Portunus trituberculatus TaxID=210409 RepID=A0A5B7EIM4_PORTR|nr:hypothetical protein [Portunus trituberculatus]